MKLSRKKITSFISFSGPQELRALFEIYRARDDLIKTYPEALRGDLHGLLNWAIKSGITIDKAKPLLEPHKEEYLRILEQTPRPIRLSKLYEKVWKTELYPNQQKLYSFIAYLGQRFGCTHLIDVGCAYPNSLVQLASKFQVISIGYGSEFDSYSQKHDKLIKWIKKDLEKTETIEIPKDILEKSAIVSISRHEKIKSQYIIDNIKKWLDFAPICILTTPLKKTNPANPEVDLTSELSEIKKELQSNSLNIIFNGLCQNRGQDKKDNAAVTIIEQNKSHTVDFKSINQASSSFRVIAIIHGYNEEDIIIPSLRKLINQGIEVYFIDNWSTDSTYDLVKQFKAKGVIGLERSPKNPSEHYDLWDYLKRVESLTTELEADWFIHQDVDEVRISPWLGTNLKDGIYRVEREGFNCIDYTVIEFPPTDNEYISGSDFESHFKYFEFAKHPANFIQMKTWKNLRQSISLAETGGHDVQFKGRKVYPYKFLLKHYPIRSQKHGEKKIFTDRMPRYHPHMRSLGWGIQYDHIRDGHIFLREKSELEKFNERNFNRDFLIERLSGIGIL